MTTSNPASSGWKPSIDPPADPFAHPLLKFTGRMMNYKTRVEGGTETQTRTFTIIDFSFDQVKVIEARDAYPFDVATIPVPYGERADTAWAALAKSFRSYLPTADIDLLVGKVQTWEFADAKMNRNTGTREAPKWEVVDGKAWQLVGIDGQKVSDIMDAVVEIIEGKTEAEIYPALMENADIRSMGGYQEVINQAANRTLLSGLVSAGVLLVENDTYHKVAS